MFITVSTSFDVSGAGFVRASVRRFLRAEERYNLVAVRGNLFSGYFPESCRAHQQMAQMGYSAL
jgi:hypothetical protein